MSEMREHNEGGTALWLLPIVILMAAVGVVALLLIFKKEAERVAPPQSVLAVEVQVMRPESVVLSLTSQGSMQALQQTQLFAEVPGKVVSISPRFEAGQYFAAGEELLRLEAIDYEVALAQSRVAWQQAELEWSQEQAAQGQAQRDWQKLGRGGVPSDLVLRKPQLARAKQAFKSAEVALRLAEKNVARTRVLAPYDGRVLSRSVSAGQFVQAGGLSALGVIYEAGTMELRLPVSEKEFLLLGLPYDYQASVTGAAAVSLPVQIRSTVFGEELVWQGVVHRVEGAVDPVSRLRSVVVRLTPQGVGDQRWPLLNEFVEARVQGKDIESAFVLPQSALVGMDAVRVVDGENILRLRTVQVAQRRDGKVIITAGLASGERVCLTALSYSIDGVAVEVKQVHD